MLSRVLMLPQEKAVWLWFKVKSFLHVLAYGTKRDDELIYIINWSMIQTWQLASPESGISQAGYTCQVKTGSCRVIFVGHSAQVNKLISQRGLLGWTYSPTMCVTNYFCLLGGLCLESFACALNCLHCSFLD